MSFVNARQSQIEREQQQQKPTTPAPTDPAAAPVDSPAAPEKRPQQRMAPAPSDRKQIEPIRSQLHIEEKPAATEPTDVDDDALIASLKKRGYDIGGVKDLERLKPQPAKVELTKEEIEAQDAEHRQKIYDSFIADFGGTDEEFKNIQAVLGKNDLELAKEDILSELKADGFTDEEAEKIYKNRYFIADEEFSSLTDKEKQLGEKKLKARGEAAKKKTADKLLKAKNAVEGRAFLDTIKKEWPSKVEAVISKIGTDLEFDVKDHENKPTKYSFKISPEDITEIKKQVETPEAWNSLILKSDNSSNIERMTELLKYEVLAKKMIANAFGEGTSRTLAAVKAVFPGKPVLTHQPGSGIRTGQTLTTDRRARSAKGLFGTNKR